MMFKRLLVAVRRAIGGDRSCSRTARAGARPEQAAGARTGAGAQAAGDSEAAADERPAGLDRRACTKCRLSSSISWR